MSWFTQTAGLWAFLALPAVLAMHLFRRRYQDQAVAALFLWEDPQMAESSGRRRQPLRRTASFWLEMLAALLAALLLSGFDPFTQGSARHIVVVLDSSGSMSASPDWDSDDSAARNRIDEQARQIVRDALAEAGRRSRLTLIQSGVRPQLLCGPAALQLDGLRALDAWTPSAPSHDLASSLQLARELAQGEHILVVSDHLPEGGQADPDLNWHACGIPLQNVGFSSLQRTRLDNGEEEVTVTVRSYSDIASSVELQVSAGEQLLAQNTLELEPNQQRTLSFPLSAGSAAIDLSLSPDTFALDNQARLLAPVDRTVRVAYQLEDAASETLRMTELLQALPNIARTELTRQAHVVFAHEHAGDQTWSVRLPKESGNREQAEAYISGFLPEKRHPLMRGLTFEGLLWTRDTQFQATGLPVLAAGEHSLLSEARRGDHRALDLNLLAARSTLARSPDWPILVSNLIEWRRDRLPGPLAVNLVSGESFVLRRSGEQQFTLNSDALQRDDIAATDVLYLDDLPPSANYQLRAQDQNEWRFAVNFLDLGESDLRQRDSGQLSASSESTDSSNDRFAESPSARLLLILLLLALAADWWVLRGRVQS